MLSVFVIYRRKQDKSYKKCHFNIDILKNLPSKFNFVISVQKIAIKSLFVSMIKWNILIKVIIKLEFYFPGGKMYILCQTM